MKNGWTPVYRLLITVMVTVGLFVLSDIRADTKEMRAELSNHLTTDVLNIQTQLGRIDERLKGLERRFNVRSP